MRRLSSERPRHLITPCCNQRVVESQKVLAYQPVRFNQEKVADDYDSSTVHWETSEFLNWECPECCKPVKLEDCTFEEE